MIKRLWLTKLLALLTLPCYLCAGHREPPPSLHILVATIGKPTLMRLLESLSPQLSSRDYLTVVFDAKDQGQLYESVERYLEKLPCASRVIMEPINLGFWGHGIRNKYAELPGDFIMHGDDDDIYTPDALTVIRKNCKGRSTLYIFKIMKSSGKILSGRKDKVSTQSGVIPSVYNSQSTWGYYYGGDGSFYAGLHKVVPKVKYVDHIIYLMRPR